MSNGKLLDVVQDAQLRSEFGDRVTTHIFRERDPEKGRRSERRELWQRERQIGGGASGQVWLEKCLQGPKQGSLRAVKQIATVESKSLRSKDFERELEALIKFSHDKYADSFVKTFGWYAGPQTLYIAMEYLAHGDLRRYMREHGAMPERDAREVCAQILEALGDMHENHFAHRDLKPENILLHSTPPNPWWVKIGDFGISKRTNLTMGQSTTFHGGTMNFMAPELLGFISGIEPLSADPFAADMWSVGETIFQMLACHQTFGNLGLLARYVHDITLFPTSQLQAKQLTAQAINLIQQLMQPVPTQRLGINKALKHEWVNTETNPTTSNHTPLEAPQPLQPLSSDLADEYLSWTTSTSRTLRPGDFASGARNVSITDARRPESPSYTLNDAVSVQLSNQFTTVLNGTDNLRDQTGAKRVQKRSRLRDLPPALGVSLSALFLRDQTHVPNLVKKCIKAIDERGLVTPGLYDGYYVPSADEDAAWIVWLFNNKATEELSYLYFPDFPAESVAGLLKHFLRKLPEGLIPESKQLSFRDAALIENPITRQDSLHALINELPDQEYATLRSLCLHLRRVKSYEHMNKMTASALAQIFGPIIFSGSVWPQKAMETILLKVDEIFDDDDWTVNDSKH